MRVVVSAASRHGATFEIAAAIAAGLSRRGLEARAIPIEEMHDFRGWDAAVLGSAVYYGQWLHAARQAVQHHASTLKQIPVWLFSSGPIGPPDKRVPKTGEVDVSRIVEAVQPVEHRLFAGKLDLDVLGLRERAVTRMIGGQPGDFRDWAAVEAFAESIAAHLGAHTPAPATAPAGVA